MLFPPFFPRSRRRSVAVLVAAGATLALCATLGRAQTPPGGEAPGAPPAPGAAKAPTHVSDFDGRDGKWAWLTTTGNGQADAWWGDGGGTSGRIGSGQGWKEIARDDWTFWVLASGAKNGALVKVGKQATPQPVEVERGLAQPGGLWVEGGKVYWIETRNAVPGGWSFVPSTGPTSRLRVREGENPPRDLAEWPGAPAGPGDILGIAGDSIYVRVRRTLATEFLKVPLAGGTPALLGTEGGEQQGVLQNGKLWWTAQSEEAMPTSDERCVRGENGATVTDWLPGRGHLMVLNGELRYAFNVMYRIPTGSGKPQAPEYLGKVPGGNMADDGRNAVWLSGVGQPTIAVPK